MPRPPFFFFFFFNDTATTEIYTLSLHDALPICGPLELLHHQGDAPPCLPLAPCARHLPEQMARPANPSIQNDGRSEEHTSELQSRPHIVCRLLLEKKKQRLRSASRATLRSRTYQ